MGRMRPSSCSIDGLRNWGAVSRMKSFQNWPGDSSCAGGGDHFQVVVRAASLNGLSPVERHRRVYAALEEPWRAGTIHELRIDAKGTE